MSPKIQTLKDFGDGWWVDEDHRLSCSKSSTYLQQPSVIVLHWTAAPYKGLAENLARITVLAPARRRPSNSPAI